MKHIKKYQKRKYQYHPKTKIKISKSLLLSIRIIDELTKNAIWAVGSLIDMAIDILSWINEKLGGLLTLGATEVQVIRGDALVDFIKQNQATGQYTAILLSQLNAMNNSVINVAMGDNRIIDNQMIRSDRGLSSEAKAQFKGQPQMKIKIAV
ncbi:MAG: hypothetical protein E7075_06700 [Bacteroidales bacterium]|nr:hypothetical protein [Bacteroidales bacterium]